MGDIVKRGLSPITNRMAWSLHISSTRKLQEAMRPGVKGTGACSNPTWNRKCSPRFDGRPTEILHWAAIVSNGRSRKLWGGG